MVARALFTLRLAPVCSPQLAKQRSLADPRALLGTTLIVHDARPHAWREWFALMDVALERPAQTIHLDSLFAAARAAERGLGVALLPRRCAVAEIERRQLVAVRITEVRYPRQLRLVYRRGELSHAATAFLESVTEKRV